nr:unnamed protein product [Callosobruchus chinensis]
MISTIFKLNGEDVQQIDGEEKHLSNGAVWSACGVIAAFLSYVRFARKVILLAILAAKQHTRYLSLMEYSEEIFNFLSIVIPSGKGVQRCYQSPNEKTLTKLTPNVDNLLLKHQVHVQIYDNSDCECEGLFAALVNAESAENQNKELRLCFKSFTWSLILFWKPGKKYKTQKT